MDSSNDLEDALHALGALLEERHQTYDIVVIGGGALLLLGLVERPTEDLDVVAQVRDGIWAYAKPLPEELRTAVRDVAEAYDLPREETHGKDWLNPGPAFLLKLGLPNGFEARTKTKFYGALTLRLASRIDQIHLKLWAATAASRARRAVDVEDLRALAPTHHELRQAAAWCSLLDGRPDFIAFDVKPILAQLGLASDLLDE